MSHRSKTVVLDRAFHERPWGRSDLPAAYGAEGRRIGEVWHQSPGAALPVLIKSLFTSESLSVQVHPDDASALRAGLPSGKEEWWLVTAAEQHSALGIGLRSPATSEVLREAALDGSIIDLMQWFPVNAGDFFHIPPGTVHAIGAGVDIVEVQQNADVTYRLYDYGRGRELHLDIGIAAAQALPHPPQLRGRLTQKGHEGEGPRLLTECPHFKVWYVDASALGAFPSGDFQIVPLAGDAVIEDFIIRPGVVLWGHPLDLCSASSDFACLVIDAAKPSCRPQCERD